MLQNKKKIKIALLASFTVRGIAETLEKKCAEVGISAEIYIGGYNQYPQEIIGVKSGLYKFSPDLIILFIDTRSLLGENYFIPYNISDEERRIFINNKVAEIKSLVGVIKSNSQAKILLHNFEVPTHSPLGILERKQKFGFTESIEHINVLLAELSKKDSQVFIFDYDAFCSRIGKNNIIDYKMYYLGDIKIAFRHIPDLCKEYLAYIKTILSLTRKCVVLDLDNTLWGGIIGEDGIQGIKLGPTPEGKPFLEFQKYLLSLFNRGVILAINSKNNPEDARKALKEHPYMILKEDHFASVRINWNDKATNMRSLAEEINIGLDSLIFIDDDKINREMIRELLPEVLVVDLPKDPALYVKTLLELDEFHTLQLTSEDMEKGKMYAAEKKRRELATSVIDLTEYLKSLKMEIEINPANFMNIPRIAQLIQKTNQFNMTTRRYSEEDIKHFLELNDFLIVTAGVKDKFGDNGIVGTAVVKKENDFSWRIDVFLLSCRVLGRRVEDAFLDFIIKYAKKMGGKELIGEFISTPKNTSAKNFYDKNNFKLISSDAGVEKWLFEFDSCQFHGPDFIKVINNFDNI